MSHPKLVVVLATTLILISITRAGGTAMPQRYGIRVKGLLDLSWLAWFDSLTITHEASGDTLLVGLLLNQAAFYGVLETARKLNLPLVFVGEIPANTPDDGHLTTG